MYPHTRFFQILLQKKFIFIKYVPEGMCVYMYSHPHSSPPHIHAIYLPYTQTYMDIWIQKYEYITIYLSSIIGNQLKNYENSRKDSN